MEKYGDNSSLHKEMDRLEIEEKNGDGLRYDIFI
jgi:hypothetical protein